VLITILPAVSLTDRIDSVQNYLPMMLVVMKACQIILEAALHRATGQVGVYTRASSFIWFTFTPSML